MAQSSPPGQPVVGEALLREPAAEPKRRPALRELPMNPTGRAAAAEEGMDPTVRAVVDAFHRRRMASRSSISHRGKPVRRRRYGDYIGQCSPDYDRDNEMSYIDSFDLGLSSSGKENVNPGRKRHLDDALFEFFRKEAVKSLKCVFSNFCEDHDVLPKSKRLKKDTFDRDDFCSYSIKYFWEVLKSLSNHQKEVIRKFGFGCLLCFKKSDIPSVFVRWLASSVDPVSSQIIVDDFKVIPISKDSVFHVTGLPNSGNVPLPDSERGAMLILSMFGLSELPHITFFGNKLRSTEVLTDKEILVCFIAVAFKCFLFPSSDGYPNTDFLHILEEPDLACSFDICEIVYEHTISGVAKFTRICKLNGRKPRVFEFCYYFLAVYYLDSLDFGARIIDQSVPRLSVWNGNMVKFFADLDHRKKNLFGKRHLKRNLPHCYREFGTVGGCKAGNGVSYGSFESSCFSTPFKQNLYSRFGSSFETKVINGIIDSVQAAAVAKDDNVSKWVLCVNNVLQFLKDSKLLEVEVPPLETNVLGSDIHSRGPAKPVWTPDCVITKEVEACTINTAPVMKPIKKVMSRYDQGLQPMKTFPAGVKGNPTFLYSDFSKTEAHANQSRSIGGYVLSNKNASPISRICFTESPNEKNSQKVSAWTNQVGARISVTGTNKAPILIDSSPKPSHAYQTPEVQTNGTRKISSGQVGLVQSVDDIYNNMANIAGNQGIKTSASKHQSDDNQEEFIDLDQQAFDERFAKDDLVILQPKNPLILPLIPNKRFPVSDLDIKNHIAIVELAYTRGIQKDYAVKYSKVHCSYISLGQSLQRGGHVDNFLIPLFCRKLFEDHHPSKSGRHHFFSFVGESILDYNNIVQLEFISKALLGAASASRGKRLELSDYLFFPICRSEHWFTFVVAFKYKLFIYLDSLYNKEDYFHTSIKNVLVKNFVKVWKLTFQTEENIFKNFGIMYANVPKQGNPHDCGVFTMKFMEVFKPEVDTRVLFSKDDIVHIRIQYANQMYLCPRNTADKSLVLHFQHEA